MIKRWDIEYAEGGGYQTIQIVAKVRDGRFVDYQDHRDRMMAYKDWLETLYGTWLDDQLTIAERWRLIGEGLSRWEDEPEV